MSLIRVPGGSIRPWFKPERARPSREALQDAEALWLFRRGNLTADETGRHPLTALSTAAFGVGPGGRGPRGDYTKTSALTSNGWYGLTEQTASWMLVVFSIPSALTLTANNYIFATRESTTANSRLFTLINTSGYVSIAQASHSTSVSTGVAAEVGKTYAVLMRVRSSGQAGTIFVNGAITNNLSGLSTSGGSGTDDFISLFDLSYSGTNFSSNVVVHACMIALSDITDEKALRITAAPFSYLFEPAHRGLWVPVSAGGAAVDLVIPDLSHVHAADAVAISTDWLLSIADTVHAHSADGITLTTDQVLAVVDVVQDHAADIVALGLDTVLAPADSAHTHTADQIALDTTGASNLTPADSVHLHAADAPALTTDSTLEASDSAHVHTAEQPAVSTGDVANLVPVDSAHTHVADALALTTDVWLAIADAVHSHLADTVGLTQADVLAILDAFHAQAGETVTLTVIESGGGSCPTVSQIADEIMARLLAARIPVNVEEVHGIQLKGSGVPPTFAPDGTMTDPGDPWLPDI